MNKKYLMIALIVLMVGIQNFVEASSGSEAEQLNDIAQEESIVRKLISDGDKPSLSYYIAAEPKTPEDQQRKEEEIDIYLTQLQQYPIAIKLMNQFRYDDTDASTLLAKAVSNNDIATVSKLLNLGIDVNAQNNNGETALITALCNDQWQIVKYLIESGADVNIQDNDGCTALHYATMFNNVPNELVQLLLKAGANPNIQNNNGNTALIKSVIGDNFPNTKLLIASGANPNIQNNNGNTALIQSAMDDNFPSTKLLIASGANPNIQNNNGNTALMWAVSSYDNFPSIKLLIDSGANPNIQDNNGDTALHIAVDHGDLQIIQQLFTYNNGSDASKEVNVRLKNKSGKTAADCAKGEHAAEIKRIIRQYAYDQKIRQLHRNSSMAFGRQL